MWYAGLSERGPMSTKIVTHAWTPSGAPGRCGFPVNNANGECGHRESVHLWKLPATNSKELILQAKVEQLEWRLAEQEPVLEAARALRKVWVSQKCPDEAIHTVLERIQKLDNKER